MSDTHPFLHQFINFESKLHTTSSQDFSLDAVKELLKRLEHPERSLKIIHVAGTKGKGSTCVMIASILREAGFSVGLYTSPHLYSLNERIRVLRPGLDSRGQRKNIFSDQISSQQLNALIRRHGPTIKEVHQSSPRGLTFFEVVTALALCHFAQQKTDYVILETGLGGRLDATNAVESLVAVITPVSLDHQNILGKTLRKIAVEKAGIIKSSSQKIIMAPQNDQVKDVMIQRCQKIGAVPFFVRPQAISCALSGSHQKINASVAIRTVESLGLRISPRTLRSALRAVFWPGRFEVVSKKPTIVLDGAHNEDSMRVLMRTLKDIYPHHKKVFVFGASQDKNIADMVGVIRKSADCILLTTFDHPRAARFKENDVKRFLKSGVHAELYEDPIQALQRAKEICGHGVVIVTGSLFLVAQIRKALMEASCTSTKV